MAKIPTQTINGKAFEYALKCANNNDATCMWNVVNSYLTGNGVKEDISKFKEKFNKGAHLVLFGGFEHFLNSYDDIKISGRGSGSDVIENYYHVGHGYGIAGEPFNCIQSVQPDPR